MAETKYADFDYKEAIRRYRLVYERHCPRTLAANAMDRQGMAYEQLRDRGSAVELHEPLAKRFQGSNVAG